MRDFREFSDYPLPLTFLNVEVFDEMMVFYMVNDRAKKVPTNLVYRILQRMLLTTKAPPWVKETFLTGADKRKAIAANVVDIMNTLPPFKGKISEVGEPEKPQHLVHDGTLIKYVSIILQQDIFQDMNEDDLAELISDYWVAIERIYPDALADANEYLLIRTIGLSSFSRLFPVIYGYCSKDGNVSSENMEKYLRYLLEKTEEPDDADFKRPIDQKWWHAVDGPGIVHGTGEGLYEDIKSAFAEKISWVVKRKKIGLKTKD